MEYSLLKAISPQLPYLKSHTPYVQLSPYPAKDLVNPGIGQATRIFSFYVPLSSISNPYEINKVESSKINQEGYGEGETNNFNLEQPTSITNNTNNETLMDDKNDNVSLEKEMSKNDIDNVVSLSPGLKESFQHPTIKIGKSLILPSKTKITKKNNEKIKSMKSTLKVVKHKFNVI